MSGLMNIGGDPNDRSYRYKMPRLVAKVEGRGNGIKTRIVNCADIASALHRKPGVLTKFFGCELGAQSRYDPKEEASIVNGAFEGDILQNKLVDSFLPKFVLCPNCGLPETDMKVKKGVVQFDCAACGYSGDADMSHKLITFILAEEKKAKEEKKKEEKKKEKEAKKKGGGDVDKAEKKESSGDKEEKKEKKKDKDKEKKKDKDKDKKKDKKKEKKVEESDEEEWFTDISAEAVEARRLAEMGAMSAGGAALVDDEDKKPAAPADEGSDSDSAEEATGLMDAMSLTPTGEELLGALMDKVGESKKGKEVLPKAEEWAEELEDSKPTDCLSVVANLPEQISKHAAIVLKALYDADAVTDEDIFTWFDNADKENACVAATEAFVDFLKD